MFYKLGIPKYSEQPTEKFRKISKIIFSCKTSPRDSFSNTGKHFCESLYFVKCYIQVAQWKKQYHCSFHRASKILRKNDFYTFTLGLTWQNKINKTSIRALYIFKLLYTWCSTKELLLLSRSTWNFKNKWLL